MIPIRLDDEGRVPRLLDLGRGPTDLILSLIKSGWDSVCKGGFVHTGCDEREMTELLLNGMRSHLDFPFGSAGTSSGAWRKNITVARGTEVVPRMGHLGMQGIPDMGIYFHDIRAWMNYHDPQAVIECKRIAGSRLDLCKLYVQQGIDRFESGKYAGDHSVGFMIGYLLGGSVSFAVERINGCLRDDGRLSEVLLATDSQSSHAVHVSRHERLGFPAPVMIHHTFLRVPD